MKPARLGLYGGSFDPIHAGHVEPVRAARDQLDLDHVVYLPTAQPPHKGGRELADALHRYAMVEIALLDDPDLSVSPFELESRGTAYTVDTVRHFGGSYPQAELHLILGADSLARLDTYREWREIVASTRLAVLERPGWEYAAMVAELAPELARKVAAGEVTGVDNPPIEASSTRLRELLAAGEPPAEGWMDGRVLQYIQKYSLYR